MTQAVKITVHSRTPSRWPSFPAETRRYVKGEDCEWADFKLAVGPVRECLLAHSTSVGTGPTMGGARSLWGRIFGLVPALFIWFFVMEHGGFVAEDANSALNFQITVMAGYLMFNGMSIAAAAAFGSSSVFSLLGTIVWALGAALSVIGFRHAWNGHHYHYPFTLDLVR